MSEQSDLLFRTQHNSAPTAAPETRLGDYLFQVLAELVAAERDRQRRELDETLQPLRRELAELRGQISAALAVLGGKSGEVVDLPRVPLKGRAHAA